MLAHICILTPYELREVQYPWFIVLQIISVSILQNLIILGPIAIILRLTSQLLRHFKHSISPLIWIRTIAIILIISPCVISWILFGIWNGCINRLVWVVFLSALAAISLLSLFLARRLGRPSAKPTATFASFILLVFAVSVYIAPVIFPHLADDNQSLKPKNGKTLYPSDKYTKQELYAKTKPDAVVFLTIDTLRADHLGCYGYPRNTTPNIDRIASEGVLFEKMLAASSGTVPSFGTLMSGMNPIIHGAMDQRGIIDPDIKMMAEYFQEVGFKTYGISSNPFLSEKAGFAQGFDEFVELGHATSDKVIAAAKKMLREAGDDSFFLWIHFMDPHTPYKPPEEFYNDFLTDDLYNPLPLPIIEYGSFGGVNIKRVMGGDQPNPYHQFVEKGHIVALYDGEIRVMDKGVGEVMELMRSLGVEDNMILFLTADHGETLFRDKKDSYFQHTLDVYQSCIHVPTIAWSGTDQSPGRRVDTVAQHIDVLPTILRMANIPQADHTTTMGRNLLSDESGPNFAVSQTAWWDGLSLKLLPAVKRYPAYSLVQNNYKYIAYPHSDLTKIRGFRSWIYAWRSIVFGYWKKDELFNLQSDPEEKEDLMEKFPKVAMMMKEYLLNYLITENQSPHRVKETPSNNYIQTEQLKALGYMD